MNIHHTLHMDLFLQNGLSKPFEQYGVLGWRKRMRAKIEPKVIVGLRLSPRL